MKNSIIMIEGYASSQEIVEGLKRKYPAYLVGERQKIKLRVKHIYVGQYRLTQAILVPETNLKPGDTYRLVIEKMPKEQSLHRWNNTLKKYDPVIFKVADDIDTTRPEFLSAPKELNKTLQRFGCGPAIFVNYKFAAKDNSQFLVKAYVKSLTSGKETIYCLSATDSVVKIGHGMCSGAFDFKDGNNYEIAFALMDASGNETLWQGERLQFTRPEEEY